MTVKKKAKKNITSQYDVDQIINRGGKVSADTPKQPTDLEVRFTLRIPQNMINEIDLKREGRVGNVSRNQWIIEAIADRLE